MSCIPASNCPVYREVKTTVPIPSFSPVLPGSTTEFSVWAPNAAGIKLRLVSGRADIPMRRQDDGTFTATASVSPGTRYFYVVDDNNPVPDPVSRLLPEGVHGPTEIIDPNAFNWTDHGWPGLALRDYIIYELHVGTFTPQGTFDGVIEKLDYLRDLGISVIEIMPVAAFPGMRNWGYDGVSPYAVQASYGGPDGLKRLVNAAHAKGLAVMLDVVYNHLGNEGNYLRQFGPYFTNRHHTPWGEAINFDGPGSEGVRRYFIDNALYWVHEYHLDGLRLDAVQTIRDDSQPHILQEVQENVQKLANELGRTVCVIAETDENDTRYTRPVSQGGMGLNAVWSDDFHHAVHAYLTDERAGYYQDFGRKEQIVRALNEGFVFQGQYFEFWKAERGTPVDGMPLPAHVICLQNHDQIGNRAKGDRLTTLVPRGARKMAAALLLLAPHTPLLFMGQEYDEATPFQFFSDYGDPVLQKAVSEGRRKEFKDFRWDEVPDPQDPATFERSKLTWDLAADHADMLRFFRELIALRRELVIAGERTCRAELRMDGAIVMQVPAEDPQVIVVAEFPGSAHGSADVEAAGAWTRVASVEEDDYGVTVYRRARP